MTLRASPLLFQPDTGTGVTVPVATCVADKEPSARVFPLNMPLTKPGETTAGGKRCNNHLGLRPACVVDHR
jgi:hypothetical protein